MQTPAISKWTTFRLTTWNCSPGNPYRDFPFSFLYILLLDFLRSPPFRVFNSLPYFSKFSKFSFSNVHLNGIRGANSCILTSEHCKSKIPQCRDAETHEKLMWQQNARFFLLVLNCKPESVSHASLLKYYSNNHLSRKLSRENIEKYSILEDDLENSGIKETRNGNLSKLRSSASDSFL